MVLSGADAESATDDWRAGCWKMANFAPVHPHLVENPGLETPVLRLPYRSIIGEAMIGPDAVPFIEIPALPKPRLFEKVV